MTNKLTTKDLMCLDEMMMLENWIATKLQFHSFSFEDAQSKKLFSQMAKKHLKNHEKLLQYLSQNSGGEDEVN